MFVLHYIDRDGKSTGPVRERDCYPIGREGTSTGTLDPIMVNHSTTARKRAQVAAARAESWVQVSRYFGPEAKLRPAYIVRVDGSSLAPRGMQVPERETCKRDSENPRTQREACFCTRCRADRRDARPAAPKAAQAL